MGRKRLAVIVGFIVASAIFMIVEMANSMVMAPPSPEVMKDPAALREYMANGPVTAYVVVLIGYLLGSFAGGFVATKMGRRWSSGITLPLIVGVLLTLCGLVLFFFMLPGQPIWFVAASLICYIPVTLIGHRFAG